MDSIEPSLWASVANSPLFKLPPELRNQIYDYVFSPSEVITPNISCSSRASFARQWHIRDYYYDDDDDDDDFSGENEYRAVQTSILSVCKAVGGEAIQVLYDTKVLRGYPIDLDIMLQSYEVNSRVRRIEITGLLELYNHHSPHGRSRHARHLRDLLERLQRLPRVKSIFILSDCLTSKHYTWPDGWMPVTGFVQEAGLGPVTCVDIGLFQLHGKFMNVQIMNKRLVEMWPAVRGTPEGYDGFDDAVAIINKIQSSINIPNVSVWASHTSLRCWVDIRQQFIALNMSGEWDRLRHAASTGAFGGNSHFTDDEFTFKFFSHAASLALCVRLDQFPLLLRGEHVLKWLGPNENSDVLAEASEFLAVNISGYRRHNDHPSAGPEWELRPTIWKTEGEGAEQTGLEYMAEQQSIAISDGSSNEFVLDPSRGHDNPHLIRRTLFINWIREFDHSHWMDGTVSHMATPLQTKQLTYLHMAVLQPFSRHSADQHRRDDWANDLLERYLMATGYLDQEAVSRTSLADLRTVMTIALDAFHADPQGDWTDSFFSNDALPLNFDNDLYPGLAWGYGSLLSEAFERYTSQGRISMTLVRQWVKESTLWS